MCLAFFCGVLLLCMLLIQGVVIWSDQALTNFLDDFIVNRLGNAAYVYRLFVNNVTPNFSQVIGSYVEAAFAGYAPVAGNTLVWPAATSVSHIAQSTAAAILFNNSSGGPQTVFGVYVTNPAGTRLYYAERDPSAPISIPVGVPYSYTPKQQSKNII